jgi:hyperosmotically inducible periplasmic protein
MKSGREMTMNLRRNACKSLLATVALAAPQIFGAVAVTAAPNSAAPAVSQKYEAWLNKQVHHELVMLPFTGVFDNLTYSVKGTEVTLGGQVVNPVTKSQAQNVVKRLEGVTRVVDNIEVLPVSPFDDQIRRAEYRAIFRDSSLSRYSMGAIPSIHIIVNNGHVILYGVVDTAADRNIATLRANSVPDVFTVTNNLRVA